MFYSLTSRKMGDLKLNETIPRRIVTHFVTGKKQTFIKDAYISNNSHDICSRLKLKVCP